MKSPTSIAIRPMYHYSEKSIRGHVFICVLSLLLLSLLRLELANHSIPLSYFELHSELQDIRLMQIDLTSQGKSLWKLEKTNPLATKIVRKLKLKSLIPS